MPLWSFPVDLSFQADGATALSQLLDAVDDPDGQAPDLAEACRRRRARHSAGPWFTARSVRDERRAAARSETRGGLTPEEVLAGLNEVLSPDDLVVEEAVTNRGAVREHLVRLRPGTLYGAGAPGLGWALGGALGVKLASPGRRVVSICGDGSFLFSVPTSALTMAAELESPFLVVVLNNGGYRAARLPVYDLFPEGHSVAAGNAVGTRFEMPPDFAALARSVRRPRRESRDDQGSRGSSREGLRGARCGPRGAGGRTHRPGLTGPLLGEGEGTPWARTPAPEFRAWITMRLSWSYARRVVAGSRPEREACRPRSRRPAR